MILRPTSFATWCASGATNLAQPDGTHQGLGWGVGEAPPSSYFNFLQQQYDQWIKYLDDQRAGILGATLSLAGAYVNFTGGWTGASVAPGALFVAATGAGATGTTSPAMAHGTLTQELIPVAMATVSSSGTCYAALGIAGSSHISTGNFALKLQNPVSATTRAIILANSTPNVGQAAGAMFNTSTIFVGVKGVTGAAIDNDFSIIVYSI